MEDPIAVLEERMRAVENKIFGISQEETETSVPIVDSLLDSQKVITSSLSGREKMVSAEKRLDQLETVLDPMYEDLVMDSAAKLTFILSMEQELELITNQLVRLKELSPSIESEQLHRLPQLRKQVDQLIIITAEHKHKFDAMDESIDDLLNKFTDIINGITAVFTALDVQVTEMEIKSNQKVVIEE